MGSFFSDEARAFALQGLALGMNDGSCPGNAPEAFRAAFDLGKSMRDEAHASQERASVDGKRSADARRAKNGTAQPFRPISEGGSEGPSMGGSEGGSEAPIELNLKPKALSLVAKSDKPKATPKPPKGGSVNIPSFDDFAAWAEAEHPDWSREAKAWYQQMASQDWITTSGRQILNAKGTFNTWLREGWIKRIPKQAPRQELQGC